MTTYFGCEPRPDPYLCACGAEAVTEIQVGWSRSRNCGQYEPLCGQCWEREQMPAIQEATRD